jgi:hypothetical protein
VSGALKQAFSYEALSRSAPDIFPPTADMAGFDELHAKADRMRAARQREREEFLEEMGARPLGRKPERP